MLLNVPPAESSPVDAVVFDWGGVLTDLPSVVVPQVLAEIGVVAIPAEQRTDSARERFQQLERGQIPLEHYLEEARRANPGSERLWDPEDEVFVFRRLHQRQAVIESVAIIREAGYLTAMLSNNVAEYWDGVLETLDVESLFDVTINSAHVGVRKPEAEIYELALGELGVTAERSVFLDDNVENLTGAQAVGMRTIHVTASDAAMFEDLGVILGSD